MPKVLDDNKVFESVIQLIAERGYSGATTKQIAEVAGMSEVTLFRKFGSKMELVASAVNHITERIGLQELVKYTGDLEGDLTRMVDGYVTRAKDYGNFLVTIYSELSKVEGLMELVNRGQSLSFHFVSLIERYQSSGELKSGYPLQLVANLVGPLLYVSMMGRFDTGLDLAEIDTQEHVRNFLDGWRA